MIEDAPNINSLWAALLVEELVRSGIDVFCVAPGSRSSPLTTAAARNPRARTVIHFDERGTAFHALGYGRATAKPAAVITTSGTALANVWPAVVEASLDRVPMIVLSGDRPPELQDTGANQTIDQVKFFGDYVRWCVTLPCPDRAVAPTVLLTTVDQAVHRGNGAVKGPVHVNCMFREPLAPIGEDQDFGDYLEALGTWLKGTRPYTEYHRPARALDQSLVQDFARMAEKHARGLVVVGHVMQGSGCELLPRLAERLGWPLLPDITSGLRLGRAGSAAVPYYDVVLGSGDFCKEHPTDFVVQLGGRPTSKHLLDYLEAQRPHGYVVVEDHPARQDPLHMATLRLDMPVSSFAEEVLPLIKRRAGSSWLSGWKAASAAALKAMSTFFSGSQTLSEPLVAWLVSHQLKGDMFLAASMPVRDLDVFGSYRQRACHVEANRGASGIDGTIASAAGFARGLRGRVTLLIGDLAFLHDINSLALLRGLDVPVVVIVVNNDGGGIFSFLPIAQHSDVFESHFATPHGLSFEFAARLFGLDYCRPDTVPAFTRAYQRALGAPTSTLIEVRTDRRENVRLHRLLRESVVEEIENG